MPLSKHRKGAPPSAPVPQNAASCTLIVSLTEAGEAHAQLAVLDPVTRRHRFYTLAVKDQPGYRPQDLTELLLEAAHEASLDAETPLTLW